MNKVQASGGISGPVSYATSVCQTIAVTDLCLLRRGARRLSSALEAVHTNCTPFPYLLHALSEAFTA